MKKVLVTVDEALWGKMKARAAERDCNVSDCVGWAFRQYLSSGVDVPVDEWVLRGVRAASVERSGADTAAEVAPAEATGRGGRPTVAELMRQINAKVPGAVVSGREMARAREARRGDESGSQVRDDDEDRGGAGAAHDLDGDGVRPSVDSHPGGGGGEQRGSGTGTQGLPVSGVRGATGAVSGGWVAGRLMPDDPAVEF